MHDTINYINISYMDLLSFLFLLFFLLSYLIKDFFCMGFKISFLILLGCLQIYSTAHIRLDEHTLQSLDNLCDFLIGLPLFLSNHLLTNISIFDIGMPYIGFKSNHREFEWELLRKIEIQNQIMPFI